MHEDYLNDINTSKQLIKRVRDYPEIFPQLSALKDDEIAKNYDIFKAADEYNKTGKISDESIENAAKIIAPDLDAYQAADKLGTDTGHFSPAQLSSSQYYRDLEAVLSGQDQVGGLKGKRSEGENVLSDTPNTITERAGGETSTEGLGLQLNEGRLKLAEDAKTKSNEKWNELTKLIYGKKSSGVLKGEGEFRLGNPTHIIKLYEGLVKKGAAEKYLKTLSPWYKKAKKTVELDKTVNKITQLGEELGLDYTDKESLFKNLDKAVEEIRANPANTTKKVGGSPLSPKLRVTRSPSNKQRQFINQVNKYNNQIKDPTTLLTHSQIDTEVKSINVGYSEPTHPYHNFSNAERTGYHELFETSRADTFTDEEKPIYELAKASTVAQKGIEKENLETMGKELTDNILDNLTRGLKELPYTKKVSGETKFENVLKVIPREKQQVAVSTALHQLMTKKNGEGLLDANNWPKFINMMKKKPVANENLWKLLPEPIREHFTALSKLLNVVKRARKNEVFTGKSLAHVADIEKSFDEIYNATRGVAGRAYLKDRSLQGTVEGIAVKYSKEAVGAISHTADKGIKALDQIMQPREANHVKSVNAFLSSPELAKGLEQIIKNPKAISSASHRLSQRPVYKKWFNNLPKKAQEIILKKGPYAYLFNLKSKQDED